MLELNRYITEHVISRGGSRKERDLIHIVTDEDLMSFLDDLGYVREDMIRNLGNNAYVPFIVKNDGFYIISVIVSSISTIYEFNIDYDSKEIKKCSRLTKSRTYNSRTNVNPFVALKHIRDNA